MVDSHGLWGRIDHPRTNGALHRLILVGFHRSGPGAHVNAGVNHGYLNVAQTVAVGASLAPSRSPRSRRITRQLALTVPLGPVLRSPALPLILIHLTS